MAARSTYLVCAALAAATLALSAITQQSLTAEGGLGWDGSQYAELTSQCWRTPMRALEPFVYRIGAPCIAALIPVSPRIGLQLVNVTSSALLLFLLAAWLRQSVPERIVPWLLAGFAFHWLTPLRQVWWYPTYIDPPALCAIVGALLLRDRPIAFALVCGFGALIRETVLVVPLAFALGRAIVADPSWRSAVYGLIAAIAGLAFTHVVTTPTSDYWMADAAYYWAYSKGLPTYLLAWFVVYGPALVLPFVCWAPVRRFFTESPEYAVMLAGVAVLAWVGGSDTERFLLWGSPIVLVMFGRAAADIPWRRARGPLMLLASSQILSGRWFLTTPIQTVEGPRPWFLLTPLTANRLEDLVSLTPDRLMGALALAQYLVLTLVLAIWFKRRVA